MLSVNAPTRRRSAAANAYLQGAVGVGLHGFWPTAYPYSDGDYEIIRHMGHPDLLERRDKRFRALSTASRVCAKDEAPLGYRRPLPVTLQVGKRGPEVPLRVADGVAGAHSEGCLDSVTLTCRATYSMSSTRVSNRSSRQMNTDGPATARRGVSHTPHVPLGSLGAGLRAPFEPRDAPPEPED